MEGNFEWGSHEKVGGVITESNIPSVQEQMIAISFQPYIAGWLNNIAAFARILVDLDRLRTEYQWISVVVNVYARYMRYVQKHQICFPKGSPDAILESEGPSLARYMSRSRNQGCQFLDEMFVHMMKIVSRMDGWHWQITCDKIRVWELTGILVSTPRPKPSLITCTMPHSRWSSPW